MHRALFLCLSVALFAGAARANIAAIHADALPQEAAILNALDDARQLERYSHAWTQDWTYPVAKEDVAARLGRDLGFLKMALGAHPDNSELLLLTGLVAHYAYNVDLDGSYDSALEALAGAEHKAPADVRAAWFRASLMCQTSHPKAGADEFLAIEATHAWNSLPAGFWDDYMECATVTAMAAHVLRAADHLESLHARASQMRGFLTETALKQFQAFDSARKYEPREVWGARNDGDEVELTSTTCGVRFRAAASWKVEDLSFRNGGCVASFSTGPYKGGKDELHPSILLLVKQPQGSETLEEFAAKFSTEGSFEQYEGSSCPAERCIALKGVQPEMYGKDGGGRGRVIAFERNQPDFPGLLFESPWELPKSNGADGAKTFHPEPVKARIPGRLFYLVVLDTAASIEQSAVKDLNLFLKNLAAE